MDKPAGTQSTSRAAGADGAEKRKSLFHGTASVHSGNGGVTAARHRECARCQRPYILKWLK